MSGGGGQTTQSTVSNAPPQQFLDAFTKANQQAQSVAQQPFTPYSGATVAGFQPQQIAGFNAINTAANAGQPFINQASQNFNNASTSLDPNNFASTVGTYQSPYTQQVVDATKAEFADQNATQLAGVRGNAASAGAFGGDREAVAEALTAKQQNLTQAPVIAGLENTGFQNAVQAAQGNAWLNNQAGVGFAGLGNEAQQQGLTGANAMIQSGGMQQQMVQQELNAPYQAYLAAQAYPFQTTGWLANIAEGLGGASGGTQTSTQPGPSAVSQIAGLGLAGAGAAGSLFGANGAFGSGAGAAGSGFVDSGSFDVPAYRGGAIPHRAGGGGIPGMMPVAIPDLGGGPPDLSLNVGPTPEAMPGAKLNILGNFGTTTTGSGGGPSGASQAEGAIGTIASIAKIASLFLANGGAVPDHGLGGLGGDMARRRLAGMMPVPVRPRGFDAGGAMADAATGGAGFDPSANLTAGMSASPQVMAGFGGNPMQAGQFQRYAAMPTEKLQAAAAMMPPSSPQGALVQRALMMRHASPQSDPAQQPQAPAQPQAGMGAMGGGAPGYAFGGRPVRRFADGGSDDGTPDDTYDTEDRTGMALPSGQLPLPPMPRPSAADLKDPQDTGMPVYKAPPSPQAGVGLKLAVGSDDDQTPNHFIVAGPSGSPGNGPTAGMGAMPSPHPADEAATASAKGGKPFPWETLMAMGLGIMGGRSPFASVNIGQGGLEGLKYGESVRLREAQQADTAEFRRATVAARNYGTDVRGYGIDTRADTSRYGTDARSATAAAINDRTNYWKGRGFDEQTANQKAVSDIQQLKQTETTTHHQAVEAQGDQRIAQNQQRIANSQAAQEASQRLRTQGMADANIRSVMGNATRRVAADLTGKLTLEQAVADEQRNMPAGATKPVPAAATPPPVAATDPLAGARAAIASGADRAAVVKRLQDNGIDPSGL